MKNAKEEALRLLNEQYEIMWAIVNSPDSAMTPEERRDLNEKLDRLLESIKKAGAGLLTVQNS
jgi:hypothetical protein